MRRVWVRALLAALCLAAGHTCAADEVADHKAFMVLRERLRPVEEQNPKDAVAQYGAFLQQHPDLSPWVGVIVCSAITDLHYKGLKDPKTALELCDWAAKKYEAHPAVVSIQVDKARVLVAEKRGPEAEALLKGQWERIVQARGNHANAAIWEYCAALEQQAKADEVIALLKKSLLQIPSLLDDNQQSQRGWMYERLADTLIKQKAFDEALQWAKVRFVEAQFDEVSIQRSTRMLSRVWGAKDPSTPTARGFFEALTDAARPNPLAEVRLPAVDAEVRKAQLSRLQGGWRQIHERISLEILAGDLVPAMTDARQLMTDKPELPAGVQEVCRVLKAADLNLKRANQFVEFVKTGTGANPLEEFLKEQEQKGGAKTGARQPLSREEWAALRRSAVALKTVRRPSAPGEGAAVASGRPVLPAAAVPPAIRLGDAGAPGVAPVRLDTGGVPARAAIGARLVSPVRAGGTAAEPAQVVGVPASVPAVSGAVGAVGLHGAGLAAVAGSVRAGELPASVSEAALKAPEILAALADGSISPEDAWASGVLTADDLERAVGQVQLGVAYDDRGFGLAGLLAVHFPERVAHPERLSVRVRLRLAGYYRQQRDVRAVSLYEQLLDECRDRAGFIQPALNGLAQYYNDTGDLRRAANTYLRAKEVTDQASVIANALIEAARLHMAIGRPSEARTIYARVARYGYGWATGMAICDQASILTAQGKHAEARRLLRQQVTGEGAEWIGLAQAEALGYSYYLTGDFGAAREQCRICVARGASATGVWQTDIGGDVECARTLLSQMDLFEKTPLVCEPQLLAVGVAWERTAIARPFWIRAHHPVPISLACSDPRVMVHTRGGWDSTGNPTEARLQGIADFAPGALTGDLSGVIRVTSPAYPGHQARVVIRVAAPPTVTVFPKALFFGPHGGQRVSERTLTLDAPCRFRVVEIETQPGVERVGQPSDSALVARTHVLRFRVRDPGGVREPVVGSIRITTDCQPKRTIEVAYIVSPG